MIFRLLAVACSLALVVGAVPAQNAEPPEVDEGREPWTIGPRVVPPPAGASDQLRASIARTPQPDPARNLSMLPTTPDPWTELIAQASAGGAKQAQELAAKLSATIVESELAGVVVRTVTPAEVEPSHSDRLFVHLHGGAYVFGGGPASTHEAILLAHFVKMPVLSIDYRMPPPHPFPAAVDDVVAVWKGLLEQRSAASMALGGTSAGGGLALAATQKLLAIGLDLPGALWAGTPWADLTRTGDSQFTNEGIDRMLVTYDGILEQAANLYADGQDLRTPLLSPVYGSFEGFPPTYLVTGTRDLFLSDTVRVHRKLRVAGVVADLNVYEALSHGGYALGADSPETQQVYGELGEFLDKHLE